MALGPNDKSFLVVQDKQIVKLGSSMKLVLIAIRKVILKLSALPSVRRQHDQDG